MVVYETGMLARSKAGHDKAQMYIITRVDDTYVYRTDQDIGSSEKEKKDACTDCSYKV